MKSQYSRAWNTEKKCEYIDERKYPMVTWIFEEGTFVPAAKITEKQKFSIATNFLGTPEAMYREDGEAVWTCELNSYGKVRDWQGEWKMDCPFRFQGQYEDGETGLYYNRFRYYSPDEGMYLSQDPIGLGGGALNLYMYVFNPNLWVDSLGLKEEPFKTPQVARRDAMRRAGIPTSQQPISQSRNNSGYEYTYRVPKPGGGSELKSVQQQTKDRSHKEEPHWEAGRVKVDEKGNPRMNEYGRPKLENEGKQKANYTCGG